MPDANKDTTKYIFDTSVLSNFAACGQEDLLGRLYKGHAVTTLMVVDEIQRGISAGYEYLRKIEAILAPFSVDGWLTVLSLENSDEQRLFIDLFSSVDSGEASCLAVGRSIEWGAII